MARHPLGPDDLALFAWAGDPQISPDGKQVAWTETSLDLDKDEPVSSIFVAAADGSGEPRRFSDGPHDFSARWSPDGRFLGYLAAVDAPPALRIAPLDGGAPLSVAAPGPVKGFEWSPNGDRVVLVVNVHDASGDTAKGGESEKGAKSGKDETAPPSEARAANAPRVVRGLFSRLDGMGWIDGRDHLFIYDVAKTTTTQLTSGDYDHAAPAWAPDGRTIAFASDRSRQRDDRIGVADIWTLDVGRRRAPKQIVTDTAFVAMIRYSPDGAHVAFSGLVGTAHRAGRDEHLYVAGVSGDAKPAVVAPALDLPTASTFGAAGFAWLGPDELTFTVADRGAVGVRRARLTERSARVVLEGELQVTGLAVSGEGAAATLAVASQWVDSPAEVSIVGLGRRTREPVRVSRAGDALRAAVTLVKAERHRTTAPDGLEIEYFALRPRRAPATRGGTKASPPPLVIDIHGGPSMNHPLNELMFHYQGLVAAGYTVILPNPRGSTSYGAKITAMSNGGWGEAPFADVLACADDAIEKGLADGKRQFVGGYSYGGYLSTWAIGHSKRFKAAVIGAPVVHPTSQIGTSDVGHYLAQAMQGDPWADRERLEAQSPLASAPAMSTPVLLHVHEGDLRCPPGQSDELYAALKWHGREVEYVRYPGGSHLSFLPMAGPPSQNEDRLRRVLDWLARHGGVPTGA